MTVRRHAELVVHVEVQRAPQGHVEQLHATTDRERRHGPSDDDAGECEVERVLFDVDVVVGVVHRFACPDGRDVATTGQEDAIGEGHAFGDLVDERVWNTGESTRWVDECVGSPALGAVIAPSGHRLGDRGNGVDDDRLAPRRPDGVHERARHDICAVAQS